MPKKLPVSSNDVNVWWVFNLQDIDPDDPDMRLFLSMGVGVDGAVKHVSKRTREGYWFNSGYLERAFYEETLLIFLAINH